MSLLLLLPSRFAPDYSRVWVEALRDKRREKIKRRKFKLPQKLEQVRAEVEEQTKCEVSPFVVAKVAQAMLPEMPNQEALAELKAALMFLAVRSALMAAIEAQRRRDALSFVIKRLSDEMDEEAAILLLLS